jgi:hypothetical protein
MDTRDASQATGLSYDQVTYAIRKRVITPTLNFGQGKAREFSLRDLTLLKLHAILRANHYPIEAIKFTIDCLNFWKWDGEPVTLMILALNQKEGGAGKSGTYTWKAGAWVREPGLMPEYKNARGLDMERWTYLVSSTFPAVKA